MNNKFIILCFISVILLVCHAYAAIPNITNGGFETGDLTGWTIDDSFQMNGGANLTSAHSGLYGFTTVPSTPNGGYFILSQYLITDFEDVDFIKFYYRFPDGIVDSTHGTVNIDSHILIIGDELGISVYAAEFTNVTVPSGWVEINVTKDEMLTNNFLTEEDWNLAKGNFYGLQFLIDVDGNGDPIDTTFELDDVTFDNSSDGLAPSASFVATPTFGSVPLIVTFTDMSANGPTSWNWSFGDGTYANTKNATHTYNTDGSYIVILNASNVDGYSNFSAIITALPSTPVASFTVSPNVGTNPLLVTFTNTSTGSIISWNWNFGDGVINYGTNSTITHTYATLGTFYPTLTVTSSVGDNLSQSVPIYVVASPIPLVDFTGTPTTGSSPLSVQFTDQSIALNGIVGWNWSFGDGNYSNVKNPIHIYPNTGQYSVTLVSTSSDSYSNYTSKIKYINVGIVSSTISANFIANQTNAPTYPAAIQFTDTSTCNPLCTQWAWDFNNDGLTDSVVQNPVYIYTYPGSYSPKLIVSNGINSGTKIRNLYITIGPAFVQPTITQPTNKWVPGYQYNGSIYAFRGDTSIDLANSTFLKYWLQNFTTTGNFSIYGFGIALMAPIMHVFGFWIYLIIWGLYLFAVWIRSQDVTLPLIIGIISIGTFGLLFPKESLPVIIVMFVVCGAIIITKLMKDSI